MGVKPSLSHGNKGRGIDVTRGKGYGDGADRVVEPCEWWLSSGAEGSGPRPFVGMGATMGVVIARIGLCDRFGV